MRFVWCAKLLEVNFRNEKHNRSWCRCTERPLLQSSLNYSGDGTRRWVFLPIVRFIHQVQGTNKIPDIGGILIQSSEGITFCICIYVERYSAVKGFASLSLHYADLFLFQIFPSWWPTQFHLSDIHGKLSLLPLLDNNLEYSQVDDLRNSICLTYMENFHCYLYWIITYTFIKRQEKHGK
jgi:hypothetical protein